MPLTPAVERVETQNDIVNSARPMIALRLLARKIIAVKNSPLAAMKTQ